MRDQKVGLGAVRGAAFYVGALVGPGVLVVPSLASQAAGPASVLAWGALLVLSVALAATFALLGTRHPVVGGVAAYVREGFGSLASGVTGVWFVTAVTFGAPAVSLVGGYYVADLAGSGRAVATAVAVAMMAAVLATNALGLRVSSGFQMALSGALVAAIAVAVIVAVPSRATHHWRPFAPHGWWAVGTAANILMWLFVGWEAMAQMANEFRHPARDIPRAVTSALVVIAALYCGIAVATVTVVSSGSKVPLADLLGAAFGRGGRDATAVLALALTMGTMNVYVASSARLAANLAQQHALPAWLGQGQDRDVPLRALAAMAVTTALFLGALTVGITGTTELVRATSACFVAVYVLVLASAVFVLRGRPRAIAAMALVAMAVVALFSSLYLLVPATAGGISLLVQTLARKRRRQAALP
ncbi:MAG: amino acid permease [Acidimicrobiales bacterium]